MVYSYRVFFNRVQTVYFISAHMLKYNLSIPSILVDIFWKKKYTES